MDRREQHQQELFSRDDGAGFWLRALYGPQAGARNEPGEDMPDGIPAYPGELPSAVRPDMTMEDYARAREQLGIDARGLDRDQVQQRGYRGDTELLPPMIGADHVRAAAAQLAANGYGPQARQAYSARQYQAAQLTRSDRSHRQCRKSLPRQW